MSNIKSGFYSGIKVNSKFTEKYLGKWMYLKIKPIPTEEEYIKVVADLIKANPVVIDDEYKVVHYNRCSNFSHHIPKKLLSDVNDAYKLIKDDTFDVVISEPIFYYPTGEWILGKQPLAVVINPTINFKEYPFHPHINGFMFKTIPASICYTDDYDYFTELSLEEKIDYTVRQLTIWLLKHSLWKVLSEKNSSYSWIGPQAPPLDDHIKIDFLSPMKKCLCGSNKPLKDCCLSKLFKKRFERELTPVDIISRVQNWNTHHLFEEEFRSNFNKAILNLK